MAEKIEVWAHKHSHRGEWFVDEKPHETKIAGTQKASTLVVHGDRHERVFTESEVRAMAEDIKKSVVELGGYYDASAKWCPLHGVRMCSIEQVFKVHGIFLDPA